MSPSSEYALDRSLDEQMRQVHALETQVRLELEPKILSDSATPDEVLTWWNTQDPLREVTARENSMVIQSVIDARNQHDTRMMHDRTLFAHGALCLGAGLVFPEAFETEDSSSWMRTVLSSAGLEQSDPYTDYVNISILVATKLSDYDVSSVDELERMIIVSEMTNSAMNLNRVEINKDFLMALTSLHFVMLDKAASYTHAQEPENASPELLKFYDQIRMLGLEASVLLLASAYSYHTQDDNDIVFVGKPELRRQQLGVLIDDFNHLFNNQDGSSTMWKRLKQSHIKGGLHEALWFLDYCMNKEMDPEKYHDVLVLPSYDNADSPEIGRPNHNRAWDFMVIDIVAGLSDHVQLKSSPQAGKPGEDKEYHPLIRPLEEQNFMDVNPKRLRARLNAYKKVYDNGFQDEDRAVIDRFTLPSFKEYMAEMLPAFDHAARSHESKLARIALAKLLNPTSEAEQQQPVRNRAERRKRARAQRR